MCLDPSQQTIAVEDDAGGLSRADLPFIVAPGLTGASPTDETIGVFGVGTKRAVVALAQDVRIRTRAAREPGYEVRFDDDWLMDDGDWMLPVFEIAGIESGATIVDLQRLRLQITEDSTEQLKTHLRATYAHFLAGNSVTLLVNGDKLEPHFFDNWAFPPDYSPRRYVGNLTTADGRVVRVAAIAGLSLESSPAAGEYGVYFYCNDRLIARALKTFDVGFTRGFAGLPHPKVSLVRVLVSLNGDARSMPWNSSKSDISTKHEIFLALRDWLVEVVKDFATLSRIWMGEWPERVFQYNQGEMVEIEVADFPVARKSYLPPLPKSRPRFGERMAVANKSVANKKPWVKGLYESVVAVDLICKQRLDERNRIALILLDSTLEIAFKEYLVNDSGVYYNDSQLLNIFSRRNHVHAEVQKYVTTIPVDDWKKVTYYNAKRNKLIHERASSGVPDSEIADFRNVVETILRKLFGLKFSNR